MNEKTMQTFYYQDKLVRTITISGVIWFAAQDICDILEIADADTAIQQLDDDEKGVAKIYTLDGEQDITIVSETGLYRLVFNSNPIKKFKPARQFSYWVRHNILPTIRSNCAARKKSKGESIMTNAMQSFDNGKFTVRTITDNGEIWFVAKDIAQALDYGETTINGNLHNLFSNVPEIWTDNKPFIVSSENGITQKRNLLCVTEQGLYFFLGRSDKPKALPYQMWIAGEIKRRKAMNENAPQIFTYNDKAVRVTEIDGEIWFVAKDVCEILELSDVNKATRNLDDDEKGTNFIRTPGGMQDMTIISESGLYALVMKSRKPNAKQFSRWVRHDVLPSIRKTGGYSLPNVSAPAPDSLNVRLKELDAKNRELDMKGAELLQHMIDNPAYPITDESKAILAHEISKLITGHDNPAMLPVASQPMYSATEIGSKFGISKTKVGKIANEYNLKPPIGESNEFGTWVRTKSQYSAHECPQFMYNDCALDWFAQHSEILS